MLGSNAERGCGASTPHMARIYVGPYLYAQGAIPRGAAVPVPAQASTLTLGGEQTQPGERQADQQRIGRSCGPVLGGVAGEHEETDGP